jgi:hypothetical protein
VVEAANGVGHVAIAAVRGDYFPGAAGPAGSPHERVPGAPPHRCPAGRPLVTPLPSWMRAALLATAVMNVGGAILFAPPGRAWRAVAGFPEAEHALYLGVVCLFVLLFALAYLWMGLAGRADRLFVAVAAVGKLSFFTLLAAFWAAGALPARAVATGAGDLVFALLFFAWLCGAPRPVPAPAVSSQARP